MYMFEGHTYQAAMSVPIPIRKWLIKRYNQQKQKEFNAAHGKKSDLDTPLSQTQKDRIKNESRKVLSDPRMADFMQSVRNK